jgi:uncharacterized protein
MKYLVLLVVFIVAIGVWRSRRAPDVSDAKVKSSPLALPQNMLVCAHCGVHIPQAEALMVSSQAYCCVEHQRLGPV